MTTVCPPLTWGCLQNILNGSFKDSVVLQILGYKRVDGDSDRFRLLLNDGIATHSFAILASHLNCLISDKQLEKFTIIGLNRYVCTDVAGGRKIIICLDVTPLKEGRLINSQISCDASNAKDASRLQFKQHEGSGINSRDTEVAASTSKENPINNVTSSKQIGQSNSCFPVSSDVLQLQNASDITSSIMHQSDKTSSLVELKPNSYLPGNTGAQCMSTSASNNQNYNNWPAASNLTSPLKKNSVLPISCLTPYQNKWTIKARVVYKSHVIDYSNVKKEGKLFSFYLIDDSEMVLKVTAFDKQAEELDHFIQLNKVYFISNASVVLARPGSSSKNEFELNINSNTKIELSNSDDESIPGLTFDFIPLDELSEKINSFVDVIGICTDVSPIETIVIKSTNRETQKLNFTLIDDKKIPVFVTLWGRDAENFKPVADCVIAIKNAKVTFFKIRCSLNVSAYSMLFIDPLLDEAHLLKTWYQNHRSTIIINSNSLSLDRMQGWKYLSEINNENFNLMPDKVDYYTVKGTIVMIQKENCMYKACPADDCFKKVVETPSGLYHCHKCNKDSNSFSWTLMLNLNIADFSNDLWAVAFRETAETVLNIKTETLSAIKEQDEDRFLDTLSQFHFQTFIFKLRSRVETYNEINRLKTTIINVEPIDFTSYTKKLLFDINRMEKLLYERA